MILHIDMDAFYASVEARDNPALRDVPLVVGGRPEGRGVVAAASYAARAYGIRSAMPMARAVRLCESLVIVPPRGSVYRQVSGQIGDIFRRYTPLIEPLSLDEAFLDVRASRRLYGPAEVIGRRIKDEIRSELDLVASVGVAPNKFLAKLASDQEKPDGFTVVKPGEVQSFLDPLPVERIWGVGKAGRGRLHAAGIHTVAELRATSAEWLGETFGKGGARLWELCHGIDERPVVTDSAARSISHETTFGTDIRDLASLETVALELTEGVCYRLRRAELKTKTVQLKVRYHDFDTVTRARSLEHRSDRTLEIWQSVRALLRGLLEGRRFAVRLVGVGVSNFRDDVRPSDAPAQVDLFAGVESVEEATHQGEDRQSRIDRLSDDIRQRFGRGKIRRGRSL